MGSYFGRLRIRCVVSIQKLRIRTAGSCCSSLATQKYIARERAREWESEREREQATMTENLNKPKLNAGYYYYYNYYARVCVWVSALWSLPLWNAWNTSHFYYYTSQRLQHATCVYAAIDKFCVCSAGRTTTKAQPLHYKPDMPDTRVYVNTHT